MRLVEDSVFSYPGYHGCPSLCRLRIYEPENTAASPWVVIASELPDNPGTSVTNACERIATEVWHKLERPDSGMVFVEHYPDRAFVGTKPLFAERYDIVWFQTDLWHNLRAPRWRASCRNEIEELIGCVLV